MLNIGVGEMMVVMLVALVVFGPKRLPEIARNAGKFIRNFQSETSRALKDLKQGIEPANIGVFDQPDPGTATEEIGMAPATEQLPAMAGNGARKRPAAATRRKTSARATTTRRKPTAAASRKATTKRSSSTAKKPPAKKGASRR